MLKESCYMQQTIQTYRTAQRAFSIHKWVRSAKKHRKHLQLSQLLTIFAVQKTFRGTDAAGQRRQFLYPHVSNSNTAAPCRVCGNAPGGFAKRTFATRSAASLCKNLFIMSTLTIRRTIHVIRWMKETAESVSSRLDSRNDFFSDLHGEEFTNRHVLLVHLFVTAFIAVCGLAEWLEGGAL